MLNLKRTYYKKDTLILGEGLHTVHPVAGQGFNLVLRDINKLQEILKYYTGLGMSFKSCSALEDFTSNRKAENIITGIGILTRLIGKDFLNLKLKDQESYWNIRDNEHELNQDYEKQF